MSRQEAKRRVDQAMLDARFGYGYVDGVACWVAVVGLDGREFQGRGETPREAGEDLERELASTFEHAIRG